MTGRAAILVLVLAVLAVSWASSFRAYFQQRSEIAALRADIAETEGNIEALQREKRRWQDDAFVRQQARERFGYVMPGERTYQVLDENGHPIDSPDQLADPDSAPTAAPPAWWDYAWESVEAAGDPVDPKDPNTIKAPAGEPAP